MNRFGKESGIEMLSRLAFILLLAVTGIFVPRSPANASQPYEELRFNSYKPVNLPYENGILSVYRLTVLVGGRGFTSTRYYVAFTDASMDEERTPPSFVAPIYPPPQDSAEYFEASSPSVSDCINTLSAIFFNGKSMLVASFNRENMQSMADNLGTPTLSIYQLQKRKPDERDSPPYSFTLLEKKNFNSTNLCDDEQIKALMAQAIKNYDKK